HLGMRPPGSGWSKTSQEGRMAQRGALRAWEAERPVTLEPALSALIDDGFGPSKHAEDPFDAVLGLLSRVEVGVGHGGEGGREDGGVRRVEGWILGQNGGASCG